MDIKYIKQFLSRKPALKTGSFLKEAGLTFNDWYALEAGKKELTQEQESEIQKVMLKYGG